MWTNKILVEADKIFTDFSRVFNSTKSVKDCIENWRGSALWNTGDCRSGLRGNKGEKWAENRGFTNGLYSEQQHSLGPVPWSPTYLHSRLEILGLKRRKFSLVPTWSKNNPPSQLCKLQLAVVNFPPQLQDNRRTLDDICRTTWMLKILAMVREERREQEGESQGC